MKAKSNWQDNSSREDMDMSGNIQSSQLMELFETELKDIYWAEKELTKEIPKMIKKATSPELIEAMEGLFKEGKELMDECEDGAMMAAGIISASQKIEHYEIASYGTLRQFAQTLRIKNAADLLEQTLTEEKAADDQLSRIAVTSINVQAAEE
jgi:ferritin-like metal-binding protein YciE